MWGRLIVFTAALVSSPTFADCAFLEKQHQQQLSTSKACADATSRLTNMAGCRVSRGGDSRLVVFVAGLRGYDSWDTLVPTLNNYEWFRAFDYLVFYPDVNKSIEENSRDLNVALSREEISTYATHTFIAHSLGGMVVRAHVTRELNRGADGRLPDAVISFATPLDNDRFLSWFTRFFRFLPYFCVLEKDALSTDKLAEITRAWEIALQGSKVTHLNVFGLDDEIVETDLTRECRPRSHVIAGDHGGIVNARKASHCGLRLLRTELLDEDVGDWKVDCSKCP